MAYMNKYQSDDYRREELIRICGEADFSRVRGFILRYDNKVVY